MQKPIETIGVVGCGHMGWILGFQCAVHGLAVRFYDIGDHGLERAKKNIVAELNSRIEQQRLTSAVDFIRTQILPSKALTG